MDVNEMMNQFRANPQMAAQFIQLMQQNGVLPPNIGQSPGGMMNWNMPTNPMAAMWWNNMMSSMGNPNNQNNSQPAQNQTQSQNQTNVQPQQMENKVSTVRVVKTPNEIKADEILMNGDISLFLQDDLNVVYGKRWTNNGTIDNMRFIREIEPDQNIEEKQNISSTTTNFDAEALMGQISKVVEGKLDQFVKDYSLGDRNTSKVNTKKGVEENGK